MHRPNTFPSGIAVQLCVGPGAASARAVGRVAGGGAGASPPVGGSRPAAIGHGVSTIASGSSSRTAGRTGPSRSNGHVQMAFRAVLQ